MWTIIQGQLINLDYVTAVRTRTRLAKDGSIREMLILEEKDKVAGLTFDFADGEATEFLRLLMKEMWNQGRFVDPEMLKK